MHFILIPLAILISFIISFVIKDKNKIIMLIKILSISFFVLFVFQLFLNDQFIWVINGGTYGDIYHEQIDIRQSLMRWVQFIVPVFLIISSFFNIRSFKNITLLIVPIIAVLSIVMFDDFMYYFMQNTSRGLYLSLSVRQILFSLQIFISLLVPFLLLFGTKHLPKFNKNEILSTISTFIFVLILMTPIYFLQSVFGYSNIKIGPFKTSIIIWILATILLMYVLYRMFRFKSYEQRFVLVVVLSLALFIHYHTMYLMGFSISRLPFQLCNIASYLYLIGLVINKRRFYDFILTVNVVGAIVALLAPDVSGGLFSFWNMHFLMEHSLVFIIPFLILVLRIMPRTDRDSFKYSWFGFLIYFIFVLIGGAIINANLPEAQQVNYFFIFDIDKASEYIPILTRLNSIEIVINDTFSIYPLFLIFIFFGYTILLMLFTLILNPLYSKIDDGLELRKSQINMYERFTKKEFKGPLNYPEDNHATN